jgi:hypothetical protein
MPSSLEQGVHQSTAGGGQGLRLHVCDLDFEQFSAVMLPAWLRGPAFVFGLGG